MRPAGGYVLSRRLPSRAAGEEGRSCSEERGETPAAMTVTTLPPRGDGLLRRAADALRGVVEEAS
jgi:hypothetical protein